MIFVYFLIVGIIEIFVCILWRIKQKGIEKNKAYRTCTGMFFFYAKSVNRYSE